MARLSFELGDRPPSVEHARETVRHVADCGWTAPYEYGALCPSLHCPAGLYMPACVMIRVMLCGAADTRNVQNEFARTVADFGGVPWHFLHGTMNYINSASSDWEENSRATVQEADVCVFVIVKEIGRITWGTEMTAALLGGKPFLVFCEQSTYERYLVLNKEFRPPADLSSLEEGTRNLVSTLREIEQERRLTAVPFSYGKFGETLRRELSRLFDIALGQMEERNRRRSIRPLLRDPVRLSAADLAAAQAIAIDEWEDKQVRKAAVRALATRRTLSKDALYSLLASEEQGVQRMTVELLPDLYPNRPPDRELLEHVVALANDSDDVGIPRRLIPVLLAMDLSAGVEALALLNVDDSGCKRRLAVALEGYEDAVAREGLQTAVAALLGRCLSQASESDWKTRCRAYLARLGAAPAATATGD